MIAALLFGFVASPALAGPIPKEQRVGIVWNNPASCLVSTDISGPFATAYSSGDDRATIAAGQAFMQRLAECVSQQATAYDRAARANFGVAGYEQDKAFGDLAYASAQVALVIEGAALRVGDNQVATLAYQATAGLHKAMDSGTIGVIVHRSEVTMIYEQALREAKRIPGFAP